MSIRWDPSMSSYGPWNQEEEPCDVCGQFSDDCICPECPECGLQGDVTCYDGGTRCDWCGIRPASFDPATCINRPHGHCSCSPMHPHGLVRSFAQVALRAQAEEYWWSGVEAQNYAEEQIYGSIHQ